MPAALRLIAACLVLMIFAPPPQAAAADAMRYAGVWRGVLDVGAARLRLELHVEVGRADVDVALVSVDQGSGRIPATAIRIDGDRFGADFGSIGAALDMVLAYDDMMEGAFTQHGARFGLVLQLDGENAPAEAAYAPPPLIGTDHDMTVNANGVTLAGSLRLPDGDGPFPALLLLNGSGSQDRDSTVMGRPLFAALASAFAEAGFASLRLDDRGVGGSDRVAPESPFDLAADAAAAMAMLRARDEIDGRCTALLGHSEGGMIAFLAAEAAQPAFILALAPMAVSMRQTLLGQAEWIILTSGGGAEQAEATRLMQEAVFAAMTAAAPGEAPAAIEAALVAHGLPQAQAAQQGAIWGQPYAVAALDLDPAPYFTAYAGPARAFFGGKDLQVIAEYNAAQFDAARGRDESAILLGLNHLFQEADTGLPSEYASAPHAMAPAALATFAEAAQALAAMVCD
ncbi:MAG: alpha/beta fold hydrolase [Maricaulaceae bacterium]|nr:alpha/beta fold hydrolase [Maricaulaceae bacterium]